MDFSKLKELARQLGGILVMNGNEPEFVVISYDKYLQKEPTKAAFTQEAGDEALIEGLNKEILALKEEVRQKETAEIQEV